MGSRRSFSMSAAMAIAGRSARPCDGCAKDRARWHCQADDAYLCERCDSSIHNTNSVSLRHDRQRLSPLGEQQIVKLELGLSSSSSSTSIKSEPPSSNSSLLLTDFSWRSGRTSSSSSHKKARTSWGKPHPNYSTLRSLVKQEPADDSFVSTQPACDVLHEVPAFFDRWVASPLDDLKHDGVALHEVPTFFPVGQHLLRTSSSASTSLLSSSAEDLSSDDVMSFVVPDQDCCDAVDSFLGDRFYEIERDMRSIMGEAAVVDVAHLCTNNNNNNSTIAAYELVVPKTELVVPKTEEDGSDTMSRDLTDFSPDTTSAELDSEEDYRIDLTDFEPDESSMEAAECSDLKPMQKLCLRLNYDDVISAWSDRGSLWADGSWPQTAPEDCKLDLAAWELTRLETATEGIMGHEFGGGGLIMVMEDGQSVVDDGCAINNNNNAREARVMRYREKRRTRLFSKKIRYEVRKLNAERRPRMKGRFIKRTSD